MPNRSRPRAHGDHGAREREDEDADDVEHGLGGRGVGEHRHILPARPPSPREREDEDADDVEHGLGGRGVGEHRPILPAQGPPESGAQVVALATP